MEMQSLIIYERPNLVQPYLVMGFEGWPDAGRVSSSVVGQLKESCEEVRIRIKDALEYVSEFVYGVAIGITSSQQLRETFGIARKLWGNG